MRELDAGVQHRQARFPEGLFALGRQGHVAVGAATALEVQAEVVSEGLDREVRDGVGGPAVMGHEGAHGVHEGPDRPAAGRKTDVFGALEQAGFQVIDREPLSAEVGQDQGGHARDVRAGHGRSRIGDVGAVGMRADDVLAGSAEVHPLSIVGEAGPAAGDRRGADGEAGLVVGRAAVGDVLVAGGKYDQAALHQAARQLVAVVVAACVLDEIVDGARDRVVLDILVRGAGGRQFRVGDHPVVVRIEVIPPAVGGDEGPLVRGLLDGRLEIAAPVPGVGAGADRVEALLREEADAPATLGVIAAGDAGHADAVVAHRGDRAGDVRPVVVSDDVRGPGHITLVPGGEAVPRQVGMVQVDAAVDDGDDHVRIADRIVLPDFLDVDVLAGIPGVVEPPHVPPVLVIGREGGLEGLLDQFHAGKGFERARGPRGGHALGVADLVPAVQALLPRPGFELAGEGEEPFHRFDAQLVHQPVEAFRTRTDLSAGKVFLDEVAHFFAEKHLHVGRCLFGISYLARFRLRLGSDRGFPHTGGERRQQDREYKQFQFHSISKRRGTFHGNVPLDL